MQQSDKAKQDSNTFMNISFSECSSINYGLNSLKTKTIESWVKP